MKRLALSLLLLTTTGASCRSRPSAQASSIGSVPADTIVGVVTEVGADPGTWLALQPREGGRSIRLSGNVAAMRNVSGAEVWLSGARQDDDFRVDEFEVRRVNGRDVDDGVVVNDPKGVALRLRTGVQRSVPNAPSALHTMNGARIWITRPAAGVTPSFGVILPAG